MIRIIYYGGAATVIILTLIFLSDSKIILFPDAMLPMTLSDLASTWLALGFLPMAAATILFCRIKHGRVFLIPAAICLGFLIFWTGVWIYGVVSEWYLTIY